MKIIGLNKEYQNKLLEMCKELFPNYEHYTFWGGEEYVGMYNIDPITREESMKDNVSIHWFEFAVFRLQKRLLETAIKQKNDDVIYKINSHNWLEECLHRDWKIRALYKNTDGSLGFKHPIEFLYELFKKLKREKNNVNNKL